VMYCLKRRRKLNKSCKSPYKRKEEKKRGEKRKKG